MKSVETEGKGYLSEQEAWNMVFKAMGRSGAEDRAKEQFEKFPPEIQRAVGSYFNLMTMALDEEFNYSVASSNFMRAYRNEVERAKDQAKLTPQIKNIMRLPTGQSEEVSKEIAQKTE